MAAGLVKQILFCDRVSTGGVGNIYEQILGTVGTRNNNEAATNALIEYCIVQGYDTIVFGETDAAPFVTLSSDTVFNAGGKQVLTDIVARFRSAGLDVGISVTGESLAGYKRIADYNATCASYEKVTQVHIISNWDNLAGNKTVYEIMRDRLVEAVDDGVGGSQVNWTAAGGRLEIYLQVGNARVVGDVFADGAIAYDQMLDLGAVLATQFTALGISPFPTIGNSNFPDPAWIYQPFIYAIRSYDPVPNWASLRARAWKTIDDNGLFFVFYDTVGQSQSIGMVIIVSPETPVTNQTGVYDATKYYAGYFFEGRAIPGSAPLTDPVVVRNKKDAYDAYIYAAYDISGSIAECANPFGAPFTNIDPPVPRNDIVGTYAPQQSIDGRRMGDWKDSIMSRLPLLLLQNTQSNTPYEDIFSTGIYAYGLEKPGLTPPLVGSYLNGQTAWTHLNFTGIIISSQYVMRKYTDSLVHGSVILDVQKYNSAVTPDYLNKYTISSYYINLGAPPYGGLTNPFPLGRMQIPYGTNYFPLFNGGAYSIWFFIINDRLATTGYNGFKLQESTGNYYIGAAYTNRNNIYSTFTSIGTDSGIWGPAARYTTVRDRKALDYHEDLHGVINAGIGFGILGQAAYFHTGFYIEFLPEPVIAGVSVDQVVSCVGGSNGIISAVIVSGNDTRGPFTYEWFVGDPDSGGVVIPGEVASSLTGRAAGEYWVRITASDLTTTSTAGGTITEPDQPLEFALEGYQDICNGQPIGAIVGGVSGGTPGYSFDWTGPAGFPGSTQPSLSGLTIPGVYNLVVTDNLGCTTSFSQEILEIITPVITLIQATLLTTCPGSTAGLSITSNYLFFDSIEWSTGATTPSIAVDAPGLYSVIGRKGTCSSYAEITVPDPVALGLTVTTQLNLVCGESKPAIAEIDPVGGCPGYTYLWTFPDLSTSTDQNQYNLTLPGDYLVTVTDSQGATFDLTVVILEEVFDVLITGPEIICAGGSGEIIVEPQGGQAPFIYVMNAHPQGATITNNGLYATVSNAMAGVYSFIVTDSNGCVRTTGVNVPGTQPIIVTAFGINADPGQNNGQASVTLVTGGTAPYVSYEWSGPNAYTGTGLTVYNLEPGVYQVVVTDTAGCTGVAYVTITQGLTLAESDLTALQCCLGKMWKKTHEAERIGDTKLYNCLYEKAKQLSRYVRTLVQQQPFVAGDEVVDPDPVRQPLAEPVECLTDEEMQSIVDLSREICNDCQCNC